LTGLVDKISKEQRSKVMSAIHSKNTIPELTLRKALFASGYRYRIHYGPKKIDIAFPKRKIAVFVDGCFWHGCPIHFHIPKSNEAYWAPKLAKNTARDQANTKELQADGWIVIRIWEHEIAELDTTLSKVKNLLEQR
jgi:DNA mismatch endonuclease, patch repair protein